MSKQIYLGLAIHNHQPSDNLPWVFERAYEQAYLPMIEALERHPQIRLCLHYSGCLLDWIFANRPQFVERVAALVARGQVEMMTGGYYEPVLPVIPDSDKLGQIVKLTRTVEQRFGQRPTGLWLAERVWEPHLPSDLAQAGVAWTVLDDTHFKLSGLGDKDLFGYYLTEEQGWSVKVFATSKALRYLIPWRSVAEVIDYLRQEAGDGHRIAVMGDDGEKFGVWPKTYAHCWEQGWMEEFFQALEQNRDWLKLISLGEYAAGFPSLGRVYLPTAAYAEMMEWALPWSAQLELSLLRQEMEAAGRQDVLKYIRGGFWRNFLAKYPEINNMHKKMLRVHGKVRRAQAVSPDSEVGLDDLWQGQCNCAYWHGVFGGIYLRHIRHGVYRHLLEAENKAEAALHPNAAWLNWERDDFDHDGIEELMAESHGQNVYIDLEEGGGILEWDLKRFQRNMCAVVTRRPEAYHHRLAQLEAAASASGSDIKTIHEIEQTKQADLSERLVYDRYPRLSLVDHFLGQGTSLEDWARIKYEELGDFVSQPYTALVTQLETRLILRLERAGHVWPGGEYLPIRVEKTLTLEASAEALTVDYRITNTSGARLDCLFASEWNLAIGEPGHREGYSYHVGDKTFQPWPGATGEMTNVAGLGIADAEFGLRLAVQMGRPATVWRFPVETVSSSEEGFELNFQGSCLLSIWPLRLEPGQSWEVRLQWQFAALSEA
ncbi:MAG: DUF1926 domain-containing protein [Chloroflexi bacterium]|nr:DUF1926 domain-containing protein [Chloroflexota bacterium]